MSGFIITMTAEDFKNIDFDIDQDHETSEVIEILKSYCPEKIKPISSSEKYYLSFKEDSLCFLLGNQKPIRVDFLNPALRKIFGQISKKDIFCKAIGLKEDLSCVYDLTAGFGQDTFLISKFVDRVVWVERNPLVCLLLEDGLRRLRIEYPELSDKFKIYFSDGLEFLKFTDLEEKSSIYFDFMFENKKSKSNKEMSFLKHITTSDKPILAADYILNAVSLTQKRIVLKAKDFEKAKLKPKHIFEGKTVKYFIF